MKTSFSMYSVEVTPPEKTCGMMPGIKFFLIIPLRKHVLIYAGFELGTSKWQTDALQLLVL